MTLILADLSKNRLNSKIKGVEDKIPSIANVANIASYNAKKMRLKRKKNLVFLA